MKTDFYRVIDNDRPARNVLISAYSRPDAMDKGASKLKTCNIRVILIMSANTQKAHTS